MRVVAATLAGKSVKAIGQAEGLGRNAVAAVLRSPGSQQLILELVRFNYSRIEKLFAGCLKAIDDGLKADKVVVAGKGRLNLGPDHFARLTAVKRLLDVVSLGRPTAKSDDNENSAPKQITYEDLCRIMKERETVQ